MSKTHEWCTDGIDPQIDVVQDQPLDFYPWIASKIDPDGYIYITEIEKLPPEAEVEKSSCKACIKQE